MPVLDLESCRTHEWEYGAAHIPREIVVARAQRTLCSDAIAVFQNLIPQAPQRGANRHGGQLATGVLERIGLAGNLVHLRQAGIEHAPEVDVAGTAASSKDHSSDGTDAHARLGTVNVAGGTVAL